MGIKKIAFLSFYSGEVYRGVETYIYELANRLVDLGVDVTVYQNGPALKNTKYKTVSINLKIDWNRKNSANKILGLPFTDYWARLVGKFTRKVLREVDKDTDVIITSNGSLQILYVRIWSLLHRVKVVTAGHSGIGADDKWNLLCFPNRFVVFTEFQKEWAHKFNPFMKLIKIPNGVDLKKFSSKNKSLKIDLPRPIVLSVGALDENKRLELAIKAVAKTKASLLLVGSGALEKELNNLGDNLMPGRLKIMNFPFNEMPSVYASVDLFTYPTVPWESFGIVLIEAMASGLGVVANDDPIRREIVGEAGYFIDPSDTDKYAEALRRALKTKWGEKPNTQAKKFDWETISKKYHTLFDELQKTK